MDALCDGIDGSGVDGVMTWDNDPSDCQFRCLDLLDAGFFCFGFKPEALGPRATGPRCQREFCTPERLVIGVRVDLAVEQQLDAVAHHFGKSRSPCMSEV